MIVKENKNQIIFTKAVDRFFGHNPRNPYWSLIALFLRKERKTTNPDLALYPREAGYRRRLEEIADVFEAESLKTYGPSLFGDDDDFFYRKEFLHGLNGIEDQWLAENFNELFDRLVQRCFYRSRLDLFSQSGEITKLAASLLPTGAKRIYNPFAGLASYAFALPEGCRYLGEEIEPVIAAIDNLKLMANGIDGAVIVRDSINEETYDCDAVISTPPYGTNINFTDSSLSSQYRDIKESAAFLLKKCMIMRLPAVIVVPAHIDNAINHMGLREELVESGMLESVVNIPRSARFRQMRIPLSVYVLNPAEKAREEIRLIWASKPEEAIYVARDLLTKNEFRLSRRLYEAIQTLQDTEAEFLPLERLGHFASHGRPTAGTGRVASPDCFRSANILKVYGPEDFPVKELPGFCSPIIEPCILIPKVGNLRGRMADCKGEVVYTSCHQFVADPEKILPQYLVLELCKEYIDVQLGSAINIPLSALRKLHIAVPTIERQEKEIETYYAKLTSELDLQLQDIKERALEDLRNELRLRRHTMNNDLAGLTDSIDLLDAFVNTPGEPFTAATHIFGDEHITLGSLSGNLKRSIRRLTNLVDNLLTTNRYGATETIDIEEFCSGVAEEKQRGGEGYSVVWISRNDAFGDGDEKPEKLTAKFSRGDLLTVFGNILANARKYGFAELDNPDIPLTQKRRDYIVRIETSLLEGAEGREETVLISLKNNGLPLADDMEPHQVFEWGKTSGDGSGLGGFHIKETVEHFGGSIDFVSLDPEENEGFTSEYRIMLPHIKE